MFVVLVPIAVTLVAIAAVFVIISLAWAEVIPILAVFNVVSMSNSSKADCTVVAPKFPAALDTTWEAVWLSLPIKLDKSIVCEFPPSIPIVRALPTNPELNIFWSSVPIIVDKSIVCELPPSIPIVKTYPLNPDPIIFWSSVPPAALVDKSTYWVVAILLELSPTGWVIAIVEVLIVPFNSPEKVFAVAVPIKFKLLLFILISPYIRPPSTSNFSFANSAIASSTLIADILVVWEDTTSKAVWLSLPIKLDKSTVCEFPPSIPMVRALPTKPELNMFWSSVPFIVDKSIVCELPPSIPIVRVSPLNPEPTMFWSSVPDKTCKLDKSTVKVPPASTISKLLPFNNAAVLYSLVVSESSSFPYLAYIAIGTFNISELLINCNPVPSLT